MKKIISALTLALAVSSAPVFASNDHQNMTGMSDMSKQMVKKMHTHMHEMQVLMEKIRNEKDASKRTQMMHDHMKNMQTGMKMMGNMNMGSGSESDARLGIIEERLDMMQMMMEQMMEHDLESSKNDSRGR